MAVLQVETEKCIQCAACAAVCPTGVVTMGEAGPEEQDEQLCVECGHCVAVCPTAAMDHRLTPLAEQIPIDEGLRFGAREAAQFLRSRRSIRSYREEEIPREKLLELLDVARCAPTGSNRQGISFQVISGKEKLHRITAATIEWMEQQEAANAANAVQALPKGSKYSNHVKIHIRAFHEGSDPILRGATHLILAVCPSDFGPRGRENATSVLTYAELYAPVLGLGTCWAGLLQHCAFSGYAPLLELLDIKDNMELAGALMAGYPDLRYHRMANRQPLRVTFG